MTILIRPGDRPQDNFTIVPNGWLRDPRMSSKARGILCYILSHNEGYKLSTSQIIQDCSDGRDAVRAGLRELEDLGYLIRHSNHDAAGKWSSWTYVLGKFDPTPPGPDDPWAPF